MLFSSSYGVSTAGSASAVCPVHGCPWFAANTIAPHPEKFGAKRPYGRGSWSQPPDYRRPRRSFLPDRHPCCTAPDASAADSSGRRAAMARRVIDKRFSWCSGGRRVCFGGGSRSFGAEEIV